MYPNEIESTERPYDDLYIFEIASRAQRIEWRLMNVHTFCACVTVFEIFKSRSVCVCVFFLMDSQLVQI